MNIVLHDGDCLLVLPTLAENSLDACVTDPPYHLTSIVKRFGDEDPKKWEAVGNGHGGGVSPYHRTSKGFMGKQWDGGDIAFRPEVWREVWRVLKPGAHLLAFGGTRTYHRMACAIEDAGFEIRDCIQWIYGSGFPKSHDVSRGIDRATKFGLFDELALRQIIGKTDGGLHRGSGDTVGSFTGLHAITAPATGAARQWQGWGTALKPACELIVLARKPLSERTVAANVLRWGTGALNIDGTRIPLDGDYKCGANGRPSQTGLGDNYDPSKANQHSNIGRWPANLIHDGSEEVVEGFPDTTSGDRNGIRKEHDEFGTFKDRERDSGYWKDGDSGSAARFFYTAKADSDDRLGSKHPTVKPLDLMQYLVRLVAPKGGTVLDPFAGTGSTGEAAFREGTRAVLIEREAEYQADIRRRIELLLAGPDERAYAGAKERMKDKPRDDGPLFDRAS